MRDAMVGLIFWVLLLLPCLVAMNTKVHLLDDSGDE